LINQEQTVPFLTRASLEVYDRNGNQIHKCDLNHLKWDGIRDQSPWSDGVYFYIFKYEDSCGEINEQKGFVHLMH
jgi:gliding motility-associated-like protein